jgi:TRAP-type transport system small permease protein
MLARLERFGLVGTRALSAAGLIALMLLAALTLADGLARWLLNQPIEGVRDVGALAIAVAVACCLPVGLMERSNITIRLAEAVGGARLGRFLDLVAAILVALVVGAIAWQFFLFAGKTARANETTMILQIPRAPFWYGVAWLFVFALVVQLIVVVLEGARCFGFAPAGKKPA